MQRYKDCDPRQTVERIKGILGELGIHPEGELESFADRFFSMRLEDRSTGLGTNGKGASPDLAWASGYGEFMERLQNDFLVNTTKKNVKVDASGESSPTDFSAWPDERLVSFDEALAECPVVRRELESDFISDDDVRTAWTDAVDPDEALAFWRNRLGETISMVPYYCVGSASLVDMPDTILRAVGQSNGLASGNTSEEALVEGMSELCERYAKARILNDELCPPPIPRDFIEEHCSVQAEMIRVIEERSPELNIVILDGSLGVGIPTVCMLFIDQRNGTIRPKFGSHPTIAVALERCMTEQYQGCTHEGENMLPRLFTSWDAWSRKTIHSFALSCSMYGSDQGIVPDRMLAGSPDWEFEPWGIDASYTNRQGARQLARLLRAVGGEVFIRANGYLGVPAFRIYVPCVTGLFSPGGDVPMLTKKFGMQNTCALAAYRRGDYALAAEFLKKNHSARDLAAAQELLLRAEGMPEEQRDVLLQAYFGAGAAAYAKAVWRSEDAKEALISFTKRENFLKSLGTKREIDEQTIARNELVLKLRRSKAENPIDQMGIHEIFESGSESLDETRGRCI